MGDERRRSRGARRPSFCVTLNPPGEQRAQGKPDARCTRGLVCNLHKKLRTRAYRSSGEHPAFPAQWFTTYHVIFLVSRALLPPSPAGRTASANFAPASGRRNHTPSPSASPALVSRKLRVHRISTHVS